MSAENEPGVSFESKEAHELDNLPATELTIGRLNKLVHGANAVESERDPDDPQKLYTYFFAGDDMIHLTGFEQPRKLREKSVISKITPGENGNVVQTYVIREREGRDILFKQMSLAPNDRDLEPDTVERSDAFVEESLHGLSEVSEKEAHDLMEQILDYGPRRPDSQEQYASQN